MESLGLSGEEIYSLPLDETLQPRQEILLGVSAADGSSRRIKLQCRIDTPVELTYYTSGGILHAVLRRMLGDPARVAG